jgi:hypothetical protein
MGGTGLEPVTPSLSSQLLALRAFAAAYSFSVLCRSFTPSAPAAFALVRSLSRKLVVARGSTIGRGFYFRSGSASPFMWRRHPS